MTALTEDRHTLERTGHIYSFPIASNTLCYAGGLATVTEAGYVRPGTVDVNSPTSVPVGRFRRQYDNRAAASNMTSSDLAEVESGIFKWDNYANDPVTLASLRKACYVLDDHTVAATSASNTRGTAGIVMDVDVSGVWVSTGPVSIAATVSPSTPVYVGTVPLAAASGGVLRYVATRSGTITSFGTVLSAALTNADAILTCAKNGTPLTGGAQTIPLSGSGANVAKITTPTETTFVAGDVVTFTVSGSATGSATAAVTINIT